MDTIKAYKGYIIYMYMYIDFLNVFEICSSNSIYVYIYIYIHIYSQMLNLGCLLEDSWAQTIYNFEVRPS